MRSTRTSTRWSQWINSQPEADPTRVGIVGFCFGGRSSLLYSLHNPTLQATSVFYGEPVTDATRLAKLEGPVLGIFGGAMHRSRSRT